MLLILLSWVIITGIFLSFGDILISIWSKISKESVCYSVFDTFFLGLSSIGALAMLISLFYPINIYISLLIISIAIVYWTINKHKALSLSKRIWDKLQKLDVLTKLLLLLAFVAILIFSIQPKEVYDFGLYYQQTMMWNQQYSVVPGLGNLHGRFGFNSSFLLLSTFFYHPELYTPFFPLNSLCVLVFTVWLVFRIKELENFLQQLFILFICLIVLFTYVLLVSSSSTDILANITTLYILLSCIFYKNSVLKKSLIFWVIPFFCITLKTSTAPIGLLSLFVLYLYLKNKEYKISFTLLSIAGFIIIPWLVRFVILTGYLIYPMAAIDIFNFDWKIPAEIVNMETTITRTWAQAPGQRLDDVLAMSFTDWIIPWFMRLSYLEKLLYILVTVSPIIVLIFYKKLKDNAIVLCSWFTAFVGFLLCFISAPTPRFGFAFIIYGGLVPFIVLFSKKYTRKYYTYTVSVILILFMGYFVRSAIKQTRINMETSIYSSLFLEPMYFDYHREKKNIYFYDYTIDGVKVYSTNNIGVNPVTCYEDCIDHCFDQSLPCTPYLNSNLEMRGSTLQDGFRIKTIK